MTKTKVQNNEKSMLTCLHCGETFKRNGQNFFKSNKFEYNKIDNFCNICKGCLRNECYSKDGLVSIENVKLVLQYLDKPFLWDLFNKINADKWDLGSYTKQLNRSQYKGLTFKNSDKDENNTNKEEIDVKNNTINDTEEEFIITKRMIKYWGKNLSQDDYEFLEDTYADWTNRYKCDTLAEEKTYQFLSLKELEIRKTRENSGNVDKLEETYRKFMSDANVTPRDANAANDPDNQNSLGLWIKDIEKYRPSEYFEDKKKYFDFYGFIDYLQRFVYRPLKNLLTGSRDFDKEFNVEKVEDTEENTDNQKVKEGEE